MMGRIRLILIALLIAGAVLSIMVAQRATDLSRQVKEGGLGPTYEEIVNRLRDYVGEDPPSSVQWAAMEDYKQELVGQEVQWLGWVAFVAPEKDLLVKEYGAAENFTGPFRADVRMYARDSQEASMYNGTVMLYELRQDVINDFRVWSNTMDIENLQKVEFGGVISSIGSDPRDPIIYIEPVTGLVITE